MIEAPTIDLIDRDNVVSSVELITPEIAKVYLSSQRNNRTPTPSRIADYADRMQRGEWRISQPLQFSSEGDLFDGQHRLMAVIASGIACEFLVIRGLPPETRLFVDIGQTRRTAQIAEMMEMGVTSLNSKLATCKAMFIGKSLKPKNQKAQSEAQKIRASMSWSFSPHELINLYQKYSDGIDFADQLKTPATAAVRAVVARAWYHENHARLQQFINVFNTGYAITQWDESAIALRNNLIVEKSGKHYGGSVARLITYKRTMSGLSNFLSNKNIRFVREKEIELYPLADFD